MAMFTYTARSATGDIMSGEREGKSRDEVVSFLRTQRLTPVKIEEKPRTNAAMVISETAPPVVVLYGV